VFATLTRTAGVDTNNSQLGTNLSSLAIGFKFFIFIFFRTLLHSCKDQFFSFHALPHSLRKTPGVGVGSSGIPKEELELSPHVKRDQRLARGCGTMGPAGNLARSDSSPELLVVNQ
jgi:hypothetical protein